MVNFWTWALFLTQTLWFAGTTGSCPAFCPIVCSHEEDTCSGGLDNTGCPLPNTCMSKTFGNDGNVCPVACPVTCPDGQLKCNGGRDKNNCQMPDTCVSNTGNFFFFSMHVLKITSVKMWT